MHFFHIPLGSTDKYIPEQFLDEIVILLSSIFTVSIFVKLSSLKVNGHLAEH